MILDGDRLKHAHRCAAIAVQAYRGRPPPPWLAQHFRQLDTEIQLSARGHQSSCKANESGTISSMEAAEMLGKSERWVRRHVNQLGGQKHGDRWRYSRTAVEKYLREREI